MPIETERKYLVINDSFKNEATASFAIAQGYISTDPDRTVRIRLKGNDAFITIKGKSSDDGLSRYEWEKSITKEEFDELIQLCLPGTIQKTRYLVPWGKYIIEVDEFIDLNSGLVIAEIELDLDDIIGDLPTWIGQEVTGDAKYYNSQLMIRPYSQW
jgi:CYTH domain-containing protein